MTAIFRSEGPLFRSTEQAGGPWSPAMLQGSATTALMMREVERLADASGFAVRRLTFDLWQPDCALSALKTEMLRDGRKAKTTAGLCAEMEPLFPERIDAADRERRPAQAQAS